jgi:hypothetical protein
VEQFCRLHRLASFMARQQCGHISQLELAS